jgi:hypothetical protein
MRKHIGSRIGVALVAVAAISGGAASWWETPAAVASDHHESPAAQADPTVDLTDLYVFGSGDEKTTLIACWDGLTLTDPAPNSAADFNPDALFAFNIDNDGDNVEDITIYWRYGQDQFGNIGVSWEGVPGADGNIVGGIETVLEAGDGAQVWTGKADDPFFFDAGAYLATLANGSLFQDPVGEGGGGGAGGAGDPILHWTKSDFLAGRNVKAAAIEIDTALLQNEEDPGPIQVWITSGILP